MTYRKRTNPVGILLLICWSAVILAAGFLSFKNEIDHHEELLRLQSRSLYQHTFKLMQWNARNSGIYIKTDNGKKNSDAHASRNIRGTADDTHLTMINPFAMVRLLSDLSPGENRPYKYQILGLDSAGSGTAPEPWELEALDAFRKGKREYCSFSRGWKGDYHYAAPLYVDGTCVSCHGNSSTGELRGAVSITIPSESFQQSYQEERKNTVMIFSFIWFLGTGIIVLGNREYGRRKLEEEVSARRVDEERERFFNILNAMPAFVYLINQDYDVVFANRAFRDFFGDPTKGKCYYVMFNRESPCPGCLLDGDHDLAARFERELHDESSDRTFHVYNYPLQDIDGSPLAMKLGFDISERIAMEEDLRTARDMALSAARAKSSFLATMSHEMRTPMNSIMGMTDLLLLHSDNSDNTGENLQVIQDASRHLLTLINDILDFSRIESGKLVLEEKPFSIRTLLHKTVKGLSILAREKELYLDLEIGEEIPDTLVGDEARVRQVLINLINNAIKFTREGGITVHVKDMDSHSENGSGRIRIDVRDTGIGIPGDRISRIFDAFHQEDNTYSRKYGGAGLGLAITRELVNLMGGEIHVESEEGKGSIFSFILPGLQLSDRRPGIPEETSSKTDWPVMPPRIADRRILLAEDNEVNRKIIRMVLERDGAIIEDATTGLEVIEKVSQKSFDMILMDIEMPEMDGLEATRVIRRGEAGEENRRIPVIAITAHVIDDVRDRCIKAGMDGFLTKPIDVKNVVSVISGYLTS